MIQRDEVLARGQVRVVHDGGGPLTGVKATCRRCPSWYTSSTVKRAVSSAIQPSRTSRYGWRRDEGPSKSGSSTASLPVTSWIHRASACQWSGRFTIR
jgi:hypothetical protein